MSTSHMMLDTPVGLTTSAETIAERAPGKFVADGANVYKRGVLVAQARSTTMARRIANALNHYIPSERGK